ncbi:hypothetical protein BT96DRAFT_1088637 [Gymnopus androsaceus JB14]|uniref:Uncharacterized protein n=1 Tax=Gymnopus androsaceus JB14 TaxID=1447944 RepID=A0A6A4GKM7_9AGAR|nr:hypothetical protein BT96DRAFT_1088637 [Gymnopus androsaceus JB14]
MPISFDVFNAVRDVHAETLIIILEGHLHIRDCNKPDGHSMVLESGRYMKMFPRLFQCQQVEQHHIE